MNTQSQSQSKRKNLLLAGATLLALALFAGAWWLLRNPAEGESEATPVVRVRTAVAETGTIAEQVSALGAISPLQQATVSAKISGPIARMDVLKNRAVRAGEVLVVLEAADLSAQLAEAKVALEEARIAEKNASQGTLLQTAAETEKALQNARANVDTARALYERRRTLYEQGGIAKKELEAAQLALTTAENDLRLAERTASLRTGTIDPQERALAAIRVKEAEERVASLQVQLGYATIRAPFNGVITDQYQFQGEYAAAGSRLFTITDLDSLVVKAAFPDTLANRIRAGDPAAVRLTGLPRESFPGTVSLVSRAADPLNRTIEVWVDLNPLPPALRVNTPVDVRITTRQIAGAVLVPAAAVLLDSPGGDEGTVMIDDAGSVARERRVKVGIRSGDRIQIISGVRPGEIVVTEGNYALPDGTKLQVSRGSGSKAGKGERQ